MKRERLHLPGLMTVETGRDWSGRWFIGYAKGASAMFRDAKALRRFLKLPPKTTSREALDSWVASLEAADTAKQRTISDTSETQTDTSLSEELLATGFGPECHLDESDPNHQTRTVI
jgi:hypothetical protein